MPRWVYTKRRPPARLRARATRTPPADVGLVVVLRQRRRVVMQRIEARQALPAPGTPQPGASGIWLRRALEARRRAVQVRSEARQAQPAPPGGARQAMQRWLRPLQRLREAARRLLRRPKRHIGIEEFTPAVHLRGFPKGANAQAASLLGDNALATSRKGWSA